MAGRTEKFEFSNDQGEKLSGRLELPSGQPTGFAIFAHCFTCSKNVSAATRISRHLGQSGIGVLRFDFTGLGNSEGDFSNTNFSSNVEDLRSAYSAMTEKFGKAPNLLIGHSLGGAATLKLSTELKELEGIVTIGAPSDTEHVSHLFADDMGKIEKEGFANVQLAGRPFTIKKQFVDDIKEQKILEVLGHSRAAYLIMHSPTDETVSIDHAANIYLALRHPKSFVGLSGVDHLVTNPADAEYIAETIATWAQRHLTLTQSTPVEVEEDIVVRSRMQNKFTQDIYSKNHHLVGDEPKSVKGDDLGMNPYELLLSSLGSCTSMTIKMYADRKEIPLSGVEVELKHEKRSFEDRDQTDEKPVKLDHISKRITLEGDLTPEQRKRLLEIAEKCPVNRTLQSEIVIESPGE